MTECIECGKTVEHFEKFWKYVNGTIAHLSCLKGRIPDETSMDQGRKDDQGKVRVDLLPTRALLNVAKVLQHGAEKYGEDNWRKVPDLEKRYRAAALRHLFALLTGEKLDPDSQLPHVDHAACCLLFLSEMSND